MLKEFITPSLACPDIDNPDHWDMPITIDLRYVATAEPIDIRMTDMRFTVVTMIGSPARRYLREEYPRFLRDWHSVRR